MEEIIPNPDQIFGDTNNVVLPAKNDNLISSLDSILQKVFPPVTWVIDKLVPSCGMVALSGAPASYKSWISQLMAISVASGTKLFDKFDSIKCGVLIIDKENNQSLIQQRFKLLQADNDLEIYFLNEDFYVENDELLNKVEEVIKDKKIKLVVFDSLIRIYKNKDENSSNDMAFVFSKLKRITEIGASVVFTHHNRKQSFFSKKISAESMRGSSDILASVDCALAVESSDGLIKITQTKLRQDMPINSFKLKVTSLEDKVLFDYDGEFNDDKEKIDNAKDAILTLLTESEKTRAELQELFKGIYGIKTIDNALESLKDKGMKVRIGERGKKYFSLGEVDHQEELTGFQF